MTGDNFNLITTISHYLFKDLGTYCLEKKITPSRYSEIQAF